MPDKKDINALPDKILTTDSSNTSNVVNIQNVTEVKENDFPWLNKAEKIFIEAIKFLLEAFSKHTNSSNLGNTLYNDSTHLLEQHDSRVSHELNKKVDKSQQTMKNYSSAGKTIVNSENSDLLILPSALFLDSKDIELHESIHDQKQAQKTIATIAVERNKKVARCKEEGARDKNEPLIPNVEISSVGTLIPYSFKDGKLISGEVVPTSFSLGKADAEDHLTNVYVLEIAGEEKVVIRSGTINSKERAEDFITLISTLHKKLGFEESGKKCAFSPSNLIVLREKHT